MSELIHQIDTWTSSHLGLTSPWGSMVLVFVISTAAFVLVTWLITRKSRRAARRLEQMSPEELEATRAYGGFFGSLTPALAAQMPESAKDSRDFGKLLRSAGLYKRSSKATIYAFRFLLLFVPLVATGFWALLAPEDQLLKILIIGGAASGILSTLPRLYVFFRRRARAQKVRCGLPDTIDMLGMCIGGGLSVSESLEHVAGQLTAYPELAEELMILKRQSDVGSLKLALADFSARVDLPEVRHLAGVLTRGTRLGTKLAGSLAGQADHLRASRRQMATQQANKTPVKLVLPLLFCFAPAALILLTGPAMLDLRDFLIPDQDSVADATPGEQFGTEGITKTLQRLEAPIAPTVGRQPTTAEASQ
ncbi:MAG: type II secretion system F family protein [Planctomycetes bacterium]|nr:type II secretion system F family protein [Planctomycetota bacterium]